jgi:hypothetical protein
MASTAVSSKIVPSLLPPCPSCNKEMRLTGVTPTSESPIYEFMCSDDGDRLSWQPHEKADRYSGEGDREC